MYLVASSIATLFLFITITVTEEQQKTIQKKLEEISKDNQNLQAEYDNLIEQIEDGNIKKTFNELKQNYDQDELDIVSLEESLAKMKAKNEKLIEEYNMKKQKLNEEENKLKEEEANFNQNNKFLKFIVSQKYYIMGVFIAFIMIQIYVLIAKSSLATSAKNYLATRIPYSAIKLKKIAFAIIFLLFVIDISFILVYYFSNKNS